ncbi:hypothetical protein G210_4871 [Candida maltosa Xu316]|uniref:Uncharacterized protein n=1 Tax=Candida maltosa (strain Xu316) TaxID=1245528 RepID=M3K4E4_CANMX|nr:hypothetical protein G210_4871 [Candida maltosa Xu316]
MNDIEFTNSYKYQQHLNSLQQIHSNNLPYRRSPLHPSSKLYSQPQPNRTFNSEWLEEEDEDEDNDDDFSSSPINSPSKLSKVYRQQSTLLQHQYQQQQQLHQQHQEDIEFGNKMSATITVNQSHSKFETPSKASPIVNYITPTSNQKHDATTISIDEVRSLNNLSVTPTPHPVISNWTIFWSMLNDIVGKDKLAKVGQYTLRLLIYHATKSQDYLSDEKFNIKLINATYNDREKKLDLLKNFIKHPANFIKIIVIMFLSTFTERAAGMVSGLSMYRQFLRFGKTPFRIRDLLVKFKDALINANFEVTDPKVRSTLFNRKTLGQFFSLYYGINDESILLYKLNVLSDPSYKKFVTRHESFGWYCETWLALYNAYENLQNLTQQEMDLKIQIQVKKRAKQLSKQLLLNGNTTGTNNLFNGCFTIQYLANSDGYQCFRVEHN